jgi:hypothetical protein
VATVNVTLTQPAAKRALANSTTMISPNI